jgi:hypothetical protein
MLRRVFPIVAALALAVPGGSPAAGEFELLSRTLIEGPAHTVSFSGDDILLGTGSGIAIFRGGSLENPAFLPLEGDPQTIVTNGSCAYVAAFTGGLVAIDVSGPGAPKETYRYKGIQAVTCAVAGGSLFVADLNERLFVFDVADPRAPRFREMKQLPFSARSLAAEGNNLVITYQGKVCVFRAAPDGVLQKLSEAPVEGDAKKGILRGGVLFILTGKGEVLCWNLDGTGTLAPRDPLQAKGVVDIAVDESGGMLLTNLEWLLPFGIERTAGPAAGGAAVKLKAGKGFTLDSVNRYAQPIATGSLTAPTRKKATKLSFSGRRFAVITPFEGMRLYEIAGRGARPLGSFATRGFAINLIAAEGFLYVANGFDGVRIARIARDGTPSWIGHLPTEEARDVALAGKHLVIADGQGGLKVADVSDPGKPKIIGRHPSSYFMSALTVAGGRAYCAGGLGGVEIVDIAESRRPKLVWKRDFSEVRGISVDERHLYVPDGDEGFRIFSLAGREPAALSVLNTPGWNCDCFVAGDIAFLADGGSGITIANVADRKNPRAIASLSLNALVREVFVLGRTLFAAAETKGIAAIDVSNPASPAVAAWYDTANDGRGIFADDDFVYAASGSGGVYTFKYRR